MSLKDDDDYFNDEIECKIIESYGAFSRGTKFWNKEVNLVSWNGRPAKLDIRNWQRDHEKCGKGIAITREEAEELVKLLSGILKAKPRVPKTLEPFYRELKLDFGAGPDECKSARNTLLKKYHPDMNAGKVAFATRKTIKIKEAYEKIMAWWDTARP